MNLRSKFVRKALPDWALGVAGNVSINVVARGFGLWSAALLARMLHPTGYGIYSYVYAIVATLAIPAQFGIPTVVSREIAVCSSLHRWGLGRGVIRWANWSIFVITVILVALSSLLLFIKAPRLPTPEFDTYALALALIPLLALDSLRGGILTGLRRVVLGRLPGEMLRPFVMCCALLVASALAPSMFSTPLEAIALTVCAAMTAYVIGGLILWRVRPVELKTVKPEYAVRHWNLSALPIGLTGGIGVLSQTAGLLIVGSMLPKAVVGQYRVAFLGANLVLMCQGALTNGLAPYYAQFAAKRDHASLRHFSARHAQAALLMSAPLTAIYIAFGSKLLALFFGPSYSQAYWPLVILSIGHLSEAAVGSAGIILYMAKEETSALFGSATGSVINVCAGLMLVPKIGINGAAIAAASSEIVCVLIWSWGVWRRLAIIAGPIPILMSRAIKQRGKD